MKSYRDYLDDRKVERGPWFTPASVDGSPQGGDGLPAPSRSDDSAVTPQAADAQTVQS